MQISGALKELFEKYLSGGCTPEEIKFLFQQFDLHADEEALRQLIQQALRHGKSNDPMQQAKVAAFTERVGDRLSQETASQRSVIPISVPFFRRWMLVAASLTALITAGIWVYFLVNGEVNRQNKPNISAYGGEVPPGSNRATLTLADGRTVDLSPEQSGIIVEDEIMYADGSLVANPATGASRLTLATPKGGTYQVILPDGSKVWLNSASSLIYPSEFSDNVRVVELEGEAYFEVNERSSAAGGPANIPFIVKTRGQEVEVLGTQFNVSAYADDEEARTTLVEGQVNVTSIGHDKPILLQPNQQATLKDGKLSIKAVDVAPFIDWKDGLFSFQETPLQDAMNQLSRWYNLEVTYDGAVPDTYFYGKIKRTNSLSNVLNILQKSGLNFRIENRDDQHNLIVLP